mmetsp:Transcript_1136/g.1975  ORF Transcript_1136/g.1975 Transcript_1136/m.1975 type:complete len:111 (+) Transcript_1136:302-634(+)
MGRFFQQGVSNGIIDHTREQWGSDYMYTSDASDQLSDPTSTACAIGSCLFVAAVEENQVATRCGACFACGDPTTDPAQREPRKQAAAESGHVTLCIEAHTSHTRHEGTYR